MAIGKPISVRRWGLWVQPPAQIAFCLTIIASSAAATAVGAALVPAGRGDLAIFTALAAMGIAEMELARQVERVRTRIDRAVHINLTSVWIFPAVLLLPPSLIAVLVAILHWHLYIRGCYRLKRVPPFRTFTSASIVLLSCYASHLVLLATGIGGIREAVPAGWAGFAAIVAGIATYIAANSSLIILALYTSGRGIQDMIKGWPGGLLLELATLILGALLAVVLVTMPGLAGWVILPVFLLHRAVLVEQFESAARLDPKTGVLNPAGWQFMAHRKLARNGAAFGVLMIDLDHFKRINDHYGHLAGDAVLTAVAGAISASVRGQDLVGRFGGEEFVVLLSEIAPPDARDIAERVRAAIARLEIPVAGTTIGRISASIGVSVGSGTALEQLLLAADAAVYRAKSNGRNRIEGD